MAKYTIFVDQIREKPAQLQIEATPPELDLAAPEYEFAEPVRGRIEIRVVGEDVYAHGKLQTQVVGRCKRCLKPAPTDLKADVDEIWMHDTPDTELPAEDEESGDFEPSLERRLEGNVIELDEVLRELLMAELPDRVLCRPDCKGLCPGCGADLNVEPCRCSPETKTGAEEEDTVPDWKKRLKDIKLDS